MLVLKVAQFEKDKKLQKAEAVIVRNRGNEYFKR